MDSSATATWQAFRRLMSWSFGLGLACAMGALWWIAANGTQLRLHLMLALGGGILLSVLLAGALMGLLFASNRSGHDQSVHDQREDISPD
jgi:hypothetical protein